MTDFLVALGLVLVIEGLVFAAGPAMAKRAMTSVLETPDATLRVVGIVTALAGLALIWLMRG
jgi:uncharacterized protein YjeT (DUF2065 family)